MDKNYLTLDEQLNPVYTDMNSYYKYTCGRYARILSSESPLHTNGSSAIIHVIFDGRPYSCDDMPRFGRFLHYEPVIGSEQHCGIEAVAWFRTYEAVMEEVKKIKQQFKTGAIL